MGMLWKEGVVASSEVLLHTLRGGTERNHEKLLVLSMSRKKTKPEVFHLRSSRTGYSNVTFSHCVLSAHTACC